MKIVVTGGGGFIGSNLVDRLLKESDGVREIVVVDDFSTGSRENLRGMDVKVLEGSVLDAELMDRAIAGADSVVHLGAIPSVPRSVAEPFPSHAANATGTLTVLESARKHDAHVIVASSSSVYGANAKLPKTETDWTRPMSPYGVSKLATEAYAIAYNYSYGLPTLAFRFFNVYGPGQAANHAYAAVIPKFLHAALRGHALSIEGDGQQTRDFTFVDTVTETIVDAAKRRVVSQSPVNLAFGTRTSLLELIGIVETELGERVMREHTSPRVGDVRASEADPALVKELFPGILPTTLQNGVRSTLDWFRQRGERP
ncbi:NAD-dependent epimerase/dehydratase family protein [Microbacterium sp.]|uniref:NAD-dependent epimerase/dehydratase family protein n=1 Tax=Microbacterium sp. TaxID=51671 RepID=UPI0028ABCCA3|nr:NAD-dependent epimerase/dehydratase family protein [Microbacterium sp.]